MKLGNIKDQTLDGAELSKPEPAKKQTQVSVELCTPTKNSYLLSREGMSVTGECWSPSAECKSVRPSNSSGSLAWFPPSSSACLLEPRVSQQGLLLGNPREHGDGGRQMAAPQLAPHGWLGWCSAEAWPCIQLQGCTLNPLQRLGTREPQHTGKEQQALSNLG